ncbi:MAG: hypothetical protein Kow0073_14980 [Immundisolibacter sp.]
MHIRFDSGTHMSGVTAITAPEADTPALRRDEVADQDPPARADVTLERVVTQLQDHVQNVHRELRFKVDESTGQTVVRVVEQETGRLIRQIPSQNVLDLRAFLDSISGLLLYEQA